MKSFSFSTFAVRDGLSTVIFCQVCCWMTYFWHEICNNDEIWRTGLTLTMQFVENGTVHIVKVTVMPLKRQAVQVTPSTAAQSETLREGRLTANVSRLSVKAYIKWKWISLEISCLIPISNRDIRSYRPSREATRSLLWTSLLSRRSCILLRMLL